MTASGDLARKSLLHRGFALEYVTFGASTVVIWELSGTDEERQRRGLRLMATRSRRWPFTSSSSQPSCWPPVTTHGHFETVIIWTAVTAVVMFTLAAGKALGNPVLQTEGRVTTIGGILAVAVLLGLTLNAAAGLVPVVTTERSRIERGIMALS